MTERDPFLRTGSDGYAVGRDRTSEAQVPPQGAPVFKDFWASATLEELAEAQQVHPLTDVRALFGTWPGEEDDGFEATIAELRHPLPAEGGGQ